jgi:anti-sigma regulatory factor (Ser/Thr protein kinase)
MSVHVTGDRTVRAATKRKALTQAVNNLLTNAERHATTGGSVEVVVTVGTSGDTAWLRVADDGPGIAASDREQVFERGYQADRHGKGDGLGLYLSRELLRQQGGDLTVDSASDGGATFVVYLPIVRVGVEIPDDGTALVFDEAQDGGEIVQASGRSAVDTQHRAPSPAVRSVVEHDRDVGGDAWRSRGDDGDVEGRTRDLGDVVEDDGDVGVRLQQRAQAVGKQQRRRSQGDTELGGGGRRHTSL